MMNCANKRTIVVKSHYFDTLALFDLNNPGGVFQQRFMNIFLDNFLRTVTLTDVYLDLAQNTNKMCPFLRGPICIGTCVMCCVKCV